MIFALFFSFVLAHKPTQKEICDDNTDSNLITTGQNGKLSCTIQIVPWVQQDHITIIEGPKDGTVFSDKEDTDSILFKDRVLKCLAYTNKNNRGVQDDSKDLVERKDFVKNYLETQHQLLVTEDENQNLIIQDLVTLSSPYTTLNCEGTNQIVLDRVRHLIDQLDSKKTS